MDYMDIPESVVPDKQFAPLETAYYNYVANPDIKNAAAFLGEASKIYDHARGDDNTHSTRMRR